MPELPTAVVAALTFVVALAMVPIVRSTMVRLAIVDTPNERSSHTGVVPRGGGIAVMVAMLLGLALSAPTRSMLVAAAGATVLGIVGLLDDRMDLPVRIRLVAQIVIAVSVATLVVLPNHTGLAAGALVVAATVIGVGYVNAFNFMDGINGISAAQAIAAGAAFALLGVLRDVDELTVGGLLLVAAFAGFAPYNAPRALIFLGDVGSYFAGFWIAGLFLLAINDGIAIETALVPLVLWITDTTVAIVVRLRNGDAIGTAHSDHAYQRLARAWRSHGRVAALAALAIGCTSAVAVLLHDAAGPARSAAFALTVAASIGLVVLARRTESHTTVANSR